MPALNQTGTDFVGLSSTVGLIATAVLTLNLLLGILLSAKYKTILVWKRLPPWLRRVDVYTLHQYGAYIGLSLAALHPALLLLAKQEHFRVRDLLFPLTAPHQRYFYCLGALAFYGFLTVVITSTAGVRQRFSNRIWKWIHFASYAAAPLFLVHGLLVDPKLQDKPVDLIDAEKVLSELGLVLFIGAAWLRVRHERQKRWSETFHVLPVAGVVVETAAACSYALEIPPAWKNRFAYRPGQFITLRLRLGDAYVKRSYSLSSSPDADGAVQISIKRAGQVSNHLNDTVRAGDRLAVLPPQGSFFITSLKRPHHYVLLAGGSGITPLYSILKTVLLKSPRSTVALLYANHDEGSIMFGTALAELQVRSSGRFSLMHVLSRPSGDWPGQRGRLTETRVAVLLDDLERANASGLPVEYYVCGPTGYMNLIEAVLRLRNVSAERIHLEAFTMGVPIDETEADRETETTLEIGARVGAARATPLKMRITFKGQTHELECRPNETVLDTALRAGLTPPFACQQGVCASCKAALKAGRVRMRLHEAITALEVEQREILTCQSIPVSAETVINFDE